MQCLIYLDQDLKIIRQKEKVETYVKEFLTIVLAILFIGLIGMGILNFFNS